ncbi:MAG: hypothetical protein ABIO16_08835 [Nocardioides sp.]
MSTDERRTSTSSRRRTAQATALVAAPLAFVVANLGSVLTTASGQDDTTARGALEISVAHPLADTLLTCVAMVGCLLLVPAALGAMSLMRETAPRLSLVSGSMMIVGYICYFGLCLQGLSTVELAQHGGVSAANIAVQDVLTDTVPYVVVALTFVVGNIIGTFLLGLALLRSRSVPRWAAYAVLAWPVLHILGGPWGEVAGAVLQAVGLAVVGRRLLAGTTAVRPTDDATPNVRPAVPAGA